MESEKSGKPFTIAIVGGGIGGVSLAISLARQNIPFHVYESAPSFQEIGAGVTFGPNVIRAMHTISPDMLRAYAKHVTGNESPDAADIFLTCRRGYPKGVDMEETDYKRWTPEKLFDLSNKAQVADGLKFPARCSVHRALFLDELVRLIPAGTATFGKALVNIEDYGENGGVKLHFADGTDATASAVVSCDGVKSVTRKIIYGPDAQAEYAGFFAYRAMPPKAEFERVFGHEIATSGNVFLYPNGYSIAYPVDHGASVNMVATCVKQGHTWEESEWRVRSNNEDLSRDLQGWHPALLEMFLKHGDGNKWGMFHSPHDQSYYRDRVCLLGDAAHATTPHLGAGAGMAIEDAMVLGKLLTASAADGSADLGYVFKAYDAVRRQRTQDAIRESHKNLARFSTASKAEGDELGRWKSDLNDTFNMIMDFDLDKSMDQAMSLLNQRRDYENL